MTRAVDHAWLVDDRGEVVDITSPWHLGWARYVGAPAALVLAAP